ncbi:MAG: DoxX family protein [Saprospiraceae bacterium]|nr:DoxX family protein [Saprospiraceae bacterium]
MSHSNFDITALILRLGFGLNMIFGHGLGKFLKLFSGAEIKFPSILGLSPTLGLSLAVLGEFIACIFIILGYKTKYAVVFSIVTMAVAAFIAHGDDPWFSRGGSSKEMAVLYLIGFVSIYFIGSGKFSLDHKLSGSF